MHDPTGVDTLDDVPTSTAQARRPRRRLWFVLTAGLLAIGATSAVIISSTDDGGTHVTALVPGPSALAEWRVVDTYAGQLEDEVGEMLVVVPAESPDDLDRAVHVSRSSHVHLLRLFLEADTSVDVGDLRGSFRAVDTEGVAHLIADDGQAAWSLRAAPGTSIDILVELAGRLDLDAPFEALDPGDAWRVAATTADVQSGHGAAVELLSPDREMTAWVRTMVGVDDTLLRLFDTPFLAGPISIRGHTGIQITSEAEGPLRLATSTRIIWMEAPDVVVAVEVSDRSGNDDRAWNEALALIEGLVSVDSDGWAVFIDEHLTGEATGQGYVAGQLADGRDYYVIEAEDEGLCASIDFRGLGCHPRTVDDRLVPEVVVERSVDGAREVLAYGYAAGGATEVTLTLLESRSVTARPSRGVWAIGIPEGGWVVSIEHWADSDSGPPRLVASATRSAGRWIVEHNDPVNSENR